MGEEQRFAGNADNSRCREENRRGNPGNTGDREGNGRGAAGRPKAGGPTGSRSFRAVGRAQEERVCAYLRQKGYRVLERNFTSRFGEIDIISKKDGLLVFTEVKYRARAQDGEAEAAVGPAKRRRIIRTADYYRVCRRIAEQVPCRFDVAAISGEVFRYYEHAFDYDGKLL